MERTLRRKIYKNITLHYGQYHIIIRIIHDRGGEMDNIINGEDYDVLVEYEKQRVKNETILQYINLRKEKGLSQEKVADKSGIARTNIVRIESRRNMPTIEVLTKLALALDMELEISFVEKKHE